MMNRYSSAAIDFIITRRRSIETGQLHEVVFKTGLPHFRGLADTLIRNRIDDLRDKRIEKEESKILTSLFNELEENSHG